MDSNLYVIVINNIVVCHGHRHYRHQEAVKDKSVRVSAIVRCGLMCGHVI